MGSLMAGWSSPFLDPETVQLERNRSLTREEIESFWREHKPNDEHLHPPLTSPRTPQERDRRQRKNFLGFPDAPDLDRAAKISDWWTRSSSAFLNEPPRDEFAESARKYAAQFHVAEIVLRKT